MQKQLPLLVLFIALTALVPADALADGKLFTRSSDYSAFEPLEQDAQQAVMHFGDGREQMVIAINYRARPGEEGLWIFPVPGTPEEVHIDLCDVFPRFWGHDFRPWARDIVHDAMLAIRASQIYPLVADLILRHARLAKEDDDGEDAAAEIHEAIERWGLRAETVTAPSTEALASHLREASLEIAPDELSPFAPYLTDAYVLVVVRVTDREAFKAEFEDSLDDDASRWQVCWPTLFVEFPTEKGFYPMRPTASYGHTRLPVTLYIIGHVEVEANPRMLDLADIYHYRQDHPDAATQSFFGLGPDTVLDYTVVYLDASASVFTSDFVFTPTRVRGHALAEAIIDLEGLVYIVVPVLFVALSYLSAGIAGLAAGLGWKRPAAVGLSNFLTVLGVAIVATFMLKQGRTGRFVGLFTLIFVALTVLIHVLLANAIGA